MRDSFKELNEYLVRLEKPKVKLSLVENVARYVYAIFRVAEVNCITRCGDALSKGRHLYLRGDERQLPPTRAWPITYDMTTSDGLQIKHVTCNIGDAQQPVITFMRVTIGRFLHSDYGREAVLHPNGEEFTHEMLKLAVMPDLQASSSEIGFAAEDDTYLLFPADLRSRLDLPDGDGYLANCVTSCLAAADAGQLLGAAGLLRAVKAVQAAVAEMEAAPLPGCSGGWSSWHVVCVVASPRFRMYEASDFGFHYKKSVDL
ncbi:malonyl-CoA:anthocyanidin 5-O-glucoside-6' [Panicum miliaceum]|uniref:Malonyl-CoA:anthocyanidin 5-O-glucoside-6 n=1 Tax=Panicum miliaceum TaxID=4540 RepID=A0A3L6Q5I0_PANMI|nr:malonyl-CoA:anthocyanidin 5-O-glucoside-6' [Panicum miliaceum]